MGSITNPMVVCPIPKMDKKRNEKVMINFMNYEVSNKNGKRGWENNFRHPYLPFTKPISINRSFKNSPAEISSYLFGFVELIQ